MAKNFVPANLAEAGISQEVYLGVQGVLSYALGADDDECILNASLQLHLAMESFDWLEVEFRLERAFAIEISRDEVFPAEIMTNADYLQRDPRSNEYCLNDAGLKALHEHQPWMNLADFANDPTIHSFSTKVTVGDLCRYIECKLASVPAKPQSK